MALPRISPATASRAQALLGSIIGPKTGMALGGAAASLGLVWVINKLWRSWRNDETKNMADRTTAEATERSIASQEKRLPRPAAVVQGANGRTDDELLKAFLTPIAQQHNLDAGQLVEDYKTLVGANGAAGQLHHSPQQLQAAAEALRNAMEKLPTSDKKEIVKAIEACWNNVTKIDVDDEKAAQQLRVQTSNYGNSIAQIFDTSTAWHTQQQTGQAAQSIINLAQGGGAAPPPPGGAPTAQGGGAATAAGSDRYNEANRLLGQMGMKFDASGTPIPDSRYSSRMRELMAPYLPAIASAGWMSTATDSSLDTRVMQMMTADALTPLDYTLMAGIDDPIQKAAYVAQKMLTRQQILMQFLTQMARMLADTAKMIIGNIR